MTEMVQRFQQLSAEQCAMAGGKGGMLARMFQAGYPVPDGFVIFPSAFSQGELEERAWEGIRRGLRDLRAKQPQARFAVRSSAASEDSAHASFAGEFETVLDVGSDEEVRSAIYTVYRSGQSERVQVYSAVHGIDAVHEIAIVVQLMVPAEIAGVLFTADPITGSRAKMTGNFVYGMGEQLVSGESDASLFSLSRPKGSYDGPREFARFAARLFVLATKLEQQLGSPQDVEWAVAHGRLYLLQTRNGSRRRFAGWRSGWIKPPRTPS